MFLINAENYYNNDGGCWPKFGGTSAAAPIVAGSVALALEAKLVLLLRHKTFLESSA